MVDLEEKGPLQKLSERLNADDLKRSVGGEVRTPFSNESASRKPQEQWGDDKVSIEADMAKHEKRRKIVKRFALFALIFFVISLIIAGFVFWRGYYMVSSKNIAIKTDGPVSVSAGIKTDFVLKIVNKNSTALLGANLLVEYPEGTRKSDNPAQELARDSINVGDIGPGEEKTFPLSAMFYGEKGGQVFVAYTLEYGVRMSNSRFNASGEYAVTIDSTPITLDVIMPTELTADQETAFRVRITSNSVSSLNNVSIRAAYPVGMTIISALPKGDADNTLWQLGTLAPGETKEINFLAKAGGLAGEERTIRFFAGLIDTGRPSVILTQYATVAKTFVVRNPFISISTEIFDSGSDVVAADAGSQMRVEIALNNNLSQNLQNASFSATFDGIIYSESSIRAGKGFYSSQSKTVSWNKNTIEKLALLPPGSNVKDELEFRLSGENEKGILNQRNPFLTIRLRAEGSTTGEGGIPTRVVYDTTRTIKIKTRTTATSVGRYANGPFVNVGPYPMKVDTETTATATFSLTNSVNDVTGAELRAKLPLYVTWKGNVSPNSEDFRFDENTREVVWDIGTIKAGIGKVTAPREASFQIGVVPNASQLNTEIDLVTDIVFKAKDEFVGRDIQQNLSPITSRFSSDSAFRSDYEKIVR